MRHATGSPLHTAHREGEKSRSSACNSLRKGKFSHHFVAVASAGFAAQNLSAGFRLSDVRVMASVVQSAAACDAAAAALAADDPEEALAAAEAAVVLQPESSRAWSLRAQALNELQLFADVLAAVPYMQSLDSDTWQQEAERASSSLQSLFALLPAAMAGTANSDPDERLDAWKELAQADPTSLQARSSIYISWLQEAARCGQPPEPGPRATL